MESFKKYVTEQAKITNIEGLKSSIEEYKKAGGTWSGSNNKVSKKNG